MAKFTVTVNTIARPDSFWKGKDLCRLLPRLYEIHEAVADVYEAIENAGLPVEEFTVKIRDAKGWCREDDKLSADVDLIVCAKKALLCQFVAGTKYGELYGEAIDLGAGRSV